MKSNHLITRVAAATAGLVASSAAFAHHPTGGAMPETAMEGLLSGLGHPIIGVDHLLFLVTAALVAAVCFTDKAKAVKALVAYMVSLIVAVTVIAYTDAPHWVEPAIGLSLLVMGVCLWMKKNLSAGFATTFSLAAGAVHGFAYAEAVIGAEPTPIGMYLLGLFMIQTTIMLVSFFGIHHWMASSPRAVRMFSQVLASAACLMGISALVMRA